MGIFKVQSSHKKHLSHGSTCEQGIKNNKKIIRNLLFLYKNNKLNLEQDYKKYKLRPCQLIMRRIKNSLNWHYGIYIFNGIIIEMGSSPKKCEKTVDNIFNDTSYIGLNTLRQFILINPTYKIITKCEQEPFTKETHREIVQRFNRILKYTGKWDYNIINNNCRTFCNLVIFNKKKNDLQDNFYVVGY